MTAREVASTIHLKEPSVVVAGDWHGNRGWIAQAIPAAARTGARTMLHLGDFGFWPQESDDLLADVDYWVASTRRSAKEPGIKRILVTPGNHEDWSDLAALFDAEPGHAVRASSSVWVLPRGFRFTIRNRSLLSFGGAASLDFSERVPGKVWWPSELPSVTAAEEAASSGQVDVLLTHDTGALHGPGIRKILTRRETGRSPAARAYSSYSRELVTAVLTGTRPSLHLHGHYHCRDSAAQVIDSSMLRVESLAMDGQPGNLVLVDLTTMSVDDIDPWPRPAHSMGLEPTFSF
ncbi:metallophosphoesterase [Microbacterium sp. NPDC058389]|uniref:metallophosphoesterase n=1 Tax=Microbacterium sp. NPDC058389 TaxID=3346475 RepID=UPI003655A584